MSTDSETDFLSAVLSEYRHRSRSREQDSVRLLARLCQKNHVDFLKICHALVELMIPTLLLPAAKLENNNILDSIANDLYKILVPLWNLQGYSSLVNAIHHAQNLASNGSVERNRRSRAKYIEDCFHALDMVYKLLNEKIIG